MSQKLPLDQADLAAPMPARPRGHQRPSRVWRRTTMRRAVGEGLALFVLGRLLAMVPADVWPALVFPVVLVARTTLFVLPPVWATLRVVSTRREKMSRRFWRLGPLLAVLGTLADMLIALVLGEALLFGGPAGPPDLVRFGMRGPQHLTLGGFLVGNVIEVVALAVYYTIAVVCTRLANGGFMRFTMPAGNGRVTL